VKSRWSRFEKRYFAGQSQTDTDPGNHHNILSGKPFYKTLQMKLLEGYAKDVKTDSDLNLSV
jgi:hypothetical protein